MNFKNASSKEAERQHQEFLKLLDEEQDEQTYQMFLEKHTRFIPREFVQNHGIGLSLVLRKLSFGADYKSDFFFFSKSSDDWHAVFIEIEKPSSQFFRGNTNELHTEFLRAIQQINQWRAWFSDQRNKEAFLASVSAIQVPSHMARNPTYIKYVLVLGRRLQYSGNESRRRLINAYEADDLKVITFDSLAEALETKWEFECGEPPQ